VQYFPSNSAIIEWISIDGLTHISYWTPWLYWLFSIRNVDRQNTVFTRHALHSQSNVLHFTTKTKQVIQSMRSNIIHYRQNPVEQNRTLNA